MTQPPGPFPRPGSLSDEQLLRLLGEALEAADPVPPDVVAMARAAPDLAGLDAELGLALELAVLVYDSLLSPGPVRGSGPARQLEFAGADVEVVLVLDDAGLTGQLVAGSGVAGSGVAGSGVAVELVRGGAVLARVETDVLGRFRVPDPPAGPLRLRLPDVGLLTPAFDT